MPFAVSCILDKKFCAPPYENVQRVVSGPVAIYIMAKNTSLPGERLLADRKVGVAVIVRNFEVVFRDTLKTEYDSR